MIVKNEERFLGGCLDSIKDVADQIIVVDTGSTDKTSDIAKQYNAQIYYFDWCDDFSAARNVSLKYATGDWILWMDADERLAPESTRHLLSILSHEKMPIVYKTNIHSIWRDNSTLQLSSAFRIFNNYKGICFSGRIHEQVKLSAFSGKAEERDSNVVIHHLGYGLDSASAKRKSRRNRKLLKQMVEESPDSAYAHYTLAQHYSMNEEHGKALKHYEKSYALKQFDKSMTASLLNTMAESHIKLGNYDIAKGFCEASLKLIPIQVGGYYLSYEIANKQNEHNDAILWLKRLYQKNKEIRASKKRISTDMLIDEDKIIYTIGLKYLEFGDLKTAVTFYEKAYENNNENIKLMEEMAGMYIQLNDFSNAERFLHLLVRIKKDPRYQDLLGIVLIRQKRFQDAITVYESMIRKDPNNDMILKRLIGLYGKIGRMSKAKEILRSKKIPIR